VIINTFEQTKFFLEQVVRSDSEKAPAGTLLEKIF